MDVDYGIDLVFQTVGKAEAGKTPGDATIYHTFLRAGSPAPGATKIDFGLEKAGPVTITIYDTAGRLVRAIIRETLVAGEHSRSWNGRDNEGHEVAAGVYFAKFQAGEKVLTQKMVLTK
jgi:flagellar hook capping protein FlgD